MRDKDQLGLAYFLLASSIAGLAAFTFITHKESKRANDKLEKINENVDVVMHSYREKAEQIGKGLERNGRRLNTVERKLRSFKKDITKIRSNTGMAPNSFKNLKDKIDGVYQRLDTIDSRLKYIESGQITRGSSGSPEKDADPFGAIFQPNKRSEPKKKSKPPPPPSKKEEEQNAGDLDSLFGEFDFN